MTLPHRKSGGELTARGLILGTALTFMFTAANIYLGLKIGLTFAASIPAAVISMAILSAFRGSNILENNIVQTVASAAGAMAAIIFVLPGLFIVGWWTEFPYWLTFGICAAGGVLGVLFTIPLRRALVTHSPLPYPEGLAAAEVLKVGESARAASPDGEARSGMRAIVLGTVLSAGLAILAAIRLAAAETQAFFRLGTGISGYGFSYSLALIGAGHLIGISAGLAILLGILIAWGGFVPFLTSGMTVPDSALAETASAVWRTQVRFIGAGAMGVAAIWTLIQLLRPSIQGLNEAIASARKPDIDGDQRDRDLSGRAIGILAVLCLIACGILAYAFANGTPLAPNIGWLVALTVFFVVAAGFAISGVCGYMAGLVGSSNSPVSGVGILAIAAAALLLLAVMPPTPEIRSALVAFALFMTALVFGVAVISNDNLQDLKTGHLVGAAPFRQQIALIIGVIASAAVIPPVMNLLAHAYGFAGAPNLTAIAADPLPAPQANLISALARGVIEANADWHMIGIGAALGLGLVLLDILLGALGKMRLPPLAVGFGIYLPLSLLLPLVIGAVLGWWYNKQADKSANPERAKRTGTLVAAGFIVGESLFGVLTAGLIVGFSNDAPMALVPADFAYAEILGVASFAALVGFAYIWLLRKARSTEPS